MAAHVQAVKFVASALRSADCEPSTSSTGQVQIATKADGTIVGIATACSYLASKAANANQLLANGDAAAAAQVSLACC